MLRNTTGFVQDGLGDWAATLECLHRQHVRHQPPFREAVWVLGEDGRAEHVGLPLDCPACDRAELPDGLEVFRTTGLWDERTTPAGLRHAHRVGDGTWGRLRVERGELRFQAQTHPAIDVVLGAGASQPIPPGVEHEVEPREGVCFYVEFLRASRGCEEK